jgi:hypothetical protein
LKKKEKKEYGNVKIEILKSYGTHSIDLQIHVHMDLLFHFNPVTIGMFHFSNNTYCIVWSRDAPDIRPAG